MNTNQFKSKQKLKINHQKDKPSSQQFNQSISNRQLFVHPLKLLQKLKLKQQSKNQVTNYSKPQIQVQQNQNSSYLFDVNVQTQHISKQKTKQIKKQIQSSRFMLNAKKQRQSTYRTKVCADGRQCRKRLTCTYAHSQQELRKPYRNRKNPCVRYQKGLCGLGSVCPDYHGNMDLKKKYKYKTLPCQDFIQGNCKKGQLCIFLHELIAQSIQDNVQFCIQSQAINNYQSQTINKYQPQATNKQQQIKIQQEQINAQIQQFLEDEIKQTKISRKKKIKDIFNSQPNKSTHILAKQVIQQQIISVNPQNKSQQPIDQGFNIQFTF